MSTSNTTSNRPPSSNRSWVRDFFKDHPKLLQKASEAFSGTRGTHDKPKVFCKRCLEDRVALILRQDAIEVENGSRQVVRTREMVELQCA
jgi:hypothetical protein